MDKRKIELAEYNALKESVSQSVSSDMWREDFIYRRLSAGFYDSGYLDKVISKDLRRHLLTYDQETGGIIIGHGPFALAPTQHVYGIQPFLHIEYQVKCLLIRVHTPVTCTVTGITKDSISAELFGQLHAVIPNTMNEALKPGAQLKASIQGLLPSKKGPATIYCKRIEVKLKFETEDD